MGIGERWPNALEWTKIHSTVSGLNSYDDSLMHQYLNNCDIHRQTEKQTDREIDKQSD